MTNLSCDVLVVGLGPAGAAAAATAARCGLAVVGVDCKREAGVPVQCAEFIPLPLARHAQAQGVLAQRVTGMNTVLPSGARVRSAFQGLTVDRAALDRALVDAAIGAGASLHFDRRLEALDAERAVGEVRSRVGDMTQISFRVLIAADGPLSAVARLLRLPALETVDTRQYTVPLLRRHHDTDIWLSGAYPGGYAWLFPKGETANLGLGMARRHAANMKPTLDALHSGLVLQGRIGRNILARTGGRIPVGGLRASLAVGRVLFAGDAAGLAHPITGAGIAAAVDSGERAGEAAHTLLAAGDAAAFAAYEEDIREQFAESFGRALARRRELLDAGCLGRAEDDAVQRRGWIAFPEYFDRAELERTARASSPQPAHDGAALVVAG